MVEEEGAAALAAGVPRTSLMGGMGAPGPIMEAIEGDTMRPATTLAVGPLAVEVAVLVLVLVLVTAAALQPLHLTSPPQLGTQPTGAGTASSSVPPPPPPPPSHPHGSLHVPRVLSASLPILLCPPPFPVPCGGLFVVDLQNVHAIVRTASQMAG